MKKDGKYKTERVITSAQSAQINVGSKNGSEMLNFCANNYLGLANHPELIAASKRATDARGFGMASVRFICGTLDIHKDLEQVTAQFHGMEDAILYSSCFDANAGIFEALLTDQDALFSAIPNHASIIDGTRLCKAKRYTYPYNDMAKLELGLKESKEVGHPVKLIVTDGVFSMDGDIAPLRDICDLAEKYDALVMIDECHATGFVGKTGRGTPELLGVENRISIINSTLGKAMGGASGGYTAARREIVDMLRQRSRPYLFSNALAPGIVGASLRAFEMISGSNALREQLLRNTHRFRDGLTAAGFTIRGHYDHPIVPVMTFEERVATEMAIALGKENIYVVGFCYPVVPEKMARIRVQLSAIHTEEQVERAIHAFTKVGKEFRLI